jgi:hypothetical protein
MNKCDLITLTEAAALMSLRLCTLRKWRLKNRLPFPVIRLSPQALRVSRNDVLKWLDGCVEHDEPRPDGG